MQDTSTRIKNFAIALEHLCSIDKITPGCIFDVSRLLSQEIQKAQKENEEQTREAKVVATIDDDIPF